MAYVTPPSKSAGNVILSADWNQYIKANWESLSGLICYYNSSSPPSGWTEFTTARGLFVVGLVSGGTLATAVGTPLTNQQNVTHTHSVAGTVDSKSASNTDKRILVNDAGAAFPAGVAGAADTALAATGTASAGSIGIPYIQLLCIQKS